ncbi:hypothetical protein Tco_0889251 [Tanacetum coccineum]
MTTSIFELPRPLDLNFFDSNNPLASAMLLLAGAITHNFSNPTNNRLRTSSNTRNQAIIQGDKVNIQSKNSAYGDSSEWVSDDELEAPEDVP